MKIIEADVWDQLDKENMGKKATNIERWSEIQWSLENCLNDIKVKYNFCWRIKRRSGVSAPFL